MPDVAVVADAGLVLTLVMGATGGTVATPAGAVAREGTTGGVMVPCCTGSARRASSSRSADARRAEGSGLVASGGNRRA